MFVDSHCHLSFPELRSRLPQILRDMEQAEVDLALCICTTIEEFAEVHRLALSDERLWCTAGVHPDTEGGVEPTEEQLLALCRLPRVVGVGETGLDYYRFNGRSLADMAWQRDRFAVHIRAARAAELPLVVHTRSAADDTVDILRHEGQGRVGGVFHCFTESACVARAALDMGFLISFSGILTFRNATQLQDVARMVPLDRCLIETDSPYLAPVPYRGRTNSPAYVPHVARQLAEIKGVSLESVAEATSRNFEALFTRVRRGVQTC